MQCCGELRSPQGEGREGMYRKGAVGGTLPLPIGGAGAEGVDCVRVPPPCDPRPVAPVCLLQAELSSPTQIHKLKSYHAPPPNLRM